MPSLDNIKEQIGQYAPSEKSLTTMQSIVSQAPALLKAYQNGDIDQRFIARTLGTAGFDKLLAEDMRQSPMFGQIMQTASNNPMALAASAKYSPFVSEAMRGVRNTQNRSSLQQQKGQALWKAQDVTNKINTVKAGHVAKAKDMSKSLSIYNKVAPRYKYNKNFKKELIARGVNFDTLPRDVKQRIDARIAKNEIEKGSKVSMFRKWHMTPNVRDMNDMRKVIGTEMRGAQSAQAALQRAQNTARQIGNIRHKPERSIDGGTMLNLTALQQFLPGAKAIKKRADLISVLNMRMPSKRELTTNVFKEKTAVRKKDNQALLVAYLNKQLRGVKEEEASYGKTTLVDTVRDILNNA